MKKEMPRPITRWQRDRRRITGRQNSTALIKLPHEKLIQSQVGVQGEATRGVWQNHVRMRSVVSTEGKASAGSISRVFRPHGSGIPLDVGCSSQAAVGQNRQHRHRTAEIVGHEYKLSRRMNA